ncbi:MAG: DUF624 domain-containing protein [Lachnospiraceae bacterium]|nr:DUF624 domain-containing protein [Lachnospiraceae bacterium]
MSNSPVIAFLNKMTDLILLNVLLIICCIPVVTAGTAITAAYYVSITSIRCGDGYVVRRFFSSFKKNFRQITPVWLVLLVCSLILAADLLFWYQMGTGFGKTMFIVSAVVAFLLLIWAMWIFPVFAKLEGKTGELLRNAAAFAVGYLPYTAIVLVITGVAVYANLVSLVANGIMVFIGFALLSYVKSFFFYRVFMNHIDEKYDDFDNPGEMRQED